MKERKQKNSHVGWIGKLLIKLPPCKLLYPLYCARHIECKAEEYMRDNIPAGLDGLKIVFLSDLHYGSCFTQEMLKKTFDVVRDFTPDLVLMGGDYVASPERLMDFAAVFPELKTRYGIYAVPGNHDGLTDENVKKNFCRVMGKKNVKMLDNSSYQLKTESGCTLLLAGIAECYHGEPDTQRSEKKAQEADYTVFLSHSPDYLVERFIEKKNIPFFQLALCGHTHGGQVTIAGKALHSSSQYGSRYLSGWFDVNGSDMMVSCGVGTSWLPVRLGTRPQVHLITLRHAEKRGDLSNV